MQAKKVESVLDSVKWIKRGMMNVPASRHVKQDPNIGFEKKIHWLFNI